MRKEYQFDEKLLEQVVGGVHVLSDQEINNALDLYKKLCGDWIIDVYKKEGFTGMKTSMKKKFGNKWFVVRCPIEDKDGRVVTP